MNNELGNWWEGISILDIDLKCTQDRVSPALSHWIFLKKENSLNEIIFLKGLYDERSKTTVTLSLSRLRCLPPVQTLEYEQIKLVSRTWPFNQVYKVVMAAMIIQHAQGHHAPQELKFQKNFFNNALDFILPVS
jgi:hypothetical protein